MLPLTKNGEKFRVSKYTLVIAFYVTYSNNIILPTARQKTRKANAPILLNYLHVYNLLWLV